MHRRRFFGVAAALTAIVALDSACGDDNSGPGAPGKAKRKPSEKVTYSPDADARDVNPAVAVSVSVEAGALRDVTLTNANGKVVPGTLSPDGKKFTVSESLGYGVTYTWAGTVTSPDTTKADLEGSFTTLLPASTVGARVQIADGQTVGIAAPVILQFSAPVKDKAAVERALTVNTTPPQAGGWAWLPNDNGGSRVHYRPEKYWQPGTKVHVGAKLYGVDHGAGVYGQTDLTLDFSIGRSQIVRGDVPSHRVQVIRDGQPLFNLACSYGEGNELRNVTRSGTHVVTEKYEDFVMNNPPYYRNVRERWAVRISNNGEFIHANPASLSAQGASNVTNGCVNLSPTDAKAYFETALYGDPVEITGTRVQLSAADGDIYDWTIPWPTWLTMSALDDKAAPVVSATPVAPAPAGGR